MFSLRASISFQYSIKLLYKVWISTLKEKFFMKAFYLLVLCGFFISKSEAAIIQANFEYDGVELRLTNDVDIFTNEFEVNDTLRLTFSAKDDGTYWDLSDNQDRSYMAFDIGFLVSGGRHIDGSYYFAYQGDTVYSVNYYYIADTTVNGGPFSVNARAVDRFDFFSIDYNLLNSSATNDFLQHFNDFNASWSIWDTLGTSDRSIPFITGDTISGVLSAPSSLYLCGFSLCLLGALRKTTQHTRPATNPLDHAH
jgi:hypothetical protein